jgi:dolichol-phosphate mannosyltransferase
MAEKIVVIPTYNEKENISAILHTIFDLQQEFHVIVIDDGSPDGTARIVKDLQRKFRDQLFIEERRGKQGLGTAYIHGFKWAITAAISTFLKWTLIFS